MLGKKVLIDATIIGYVGNSSEQQYQVLLPNGSATLVAPNNIHESTVLVNPKPIELEAEEFKENHYRENKKKA